MRTLETTRRSVNLAWGIALLLVAGSGFACLGQAAALPPSQSSTVRIWGHGRHGQDYIGTLLRAWQDGFRKTHPGVTFEDRLYGDASGLGSLYTGVGDLALLDHEAGFIEDDGYRQGAGHAPFAIPVAMGAVGVPNRAPAILVYINRANPITQVTLDQLDGIFDADHRRGDRSYKTWGDLGLTGEWAAHAIHIYVPELTSPEVQFFEQAAMKGSQKFSCCLTLFHSTAGRSADEQIADALRNDRYGIAISTQLASVLKQLALAPAKDSPGVLATAKTVSDGSYPLARTLYLFANRTPGAPLPAPLGDFLAYIVSPEGQALVAHPGGYLPLPTTSVLHAQELLR